MFLGAGGGGRGQKGTFGRNGLRVISEALTQEVLFKKGILEIFTKFTGKHPCRSLFFD